MAIAQKPKKVTVGSDEHAGSDSIVVEINVDEFQDARRNPVWRDFAKSAMNYREKLRRNGRSA